MAQVNFKFGDFCRLCLKQSEDLVYLKATDTDLVSFDDKLEFINNALKPENDIFPNWICIRCKKQLSFAYKFSKKCLKSLTVLNECLNQIQQNHFNDMGKQFYITNIKNIHHKNSSSDEDPLTINDDELNDLEDDNSINFDNISIPIKQEPVDIEIDEHPIENNEDITSNLTVESNNGESSSMEEEVEYNIAKVKVEPQFQEDFEVRNYLTTAWGSETTPTDLLVPTETFRNDATRRKYTKKSLNGPDKPIVYTCSICFRSYQSENLLANHIATHENMYSCSLCGKTFKVKQFFARHLESHLTDDDHHFICKVCGEKFTNIRKFRQHHSEHYSKYKKMGIGVPTKEMIEKSFKKKKDEEFECNICNEKYDQRRALIIHMRGHFD